MPQTLFRVLRPKEWQEADKRGYLCAADPLEGPLENDTIQDHVLNGSTHVLSFTADLNVALAFGGCLSDIAVVQEAGLPSDRVCRLDKGYFQDQHLSNKQAIQRSRRSDEVLVSCEIPFKKVELLRTNCTNCESVFVPQFVDKDRADFPSEDSLMAALNDRTSLGAERVSTANKRFFKLIVNGTTWLARTPRPNVDLEKQVLFGEELVQQSYHEFACFGAYRMLCSEHAPRCVLYRLSFEWEPVNGLPAPSAPVSWSLLLMENLEFQPDPSPSERLRSAALALLPVDVLLGNWYCAGDADTFDRLASEHEAVYGWRPSSGHWVRLAVDRALDGTLAEDLAKDGKHNRPLKENPLLLLKSLKNEHAWLYASVTGFDSFMQMYGGPDTKHTLMDEIGQFVNSVLPEDTGCIVEALKMRNSELVMRLPFQKLRRSAPVACDGHAVVYVALPKHKYLYLLGGNSKKGALRSVYRAELSSDGVSDWKPMRGMPVKGRYSFTATHWNDFIVVFGGFGGSSCPVSFNDLLFYNIHDDKWISQRPANREKWPDPRCRHTATLHKGCLYVIGGCAKSSLHDVWRAELDGQGPKVRWTKQGSLLKAVHRHWVLVQGDALLVVGGFHQPLSRIQRVPLGQDPTVTMHITNHVNLGETGRASLVGFAAVMDEADRRLIVFGGDVPRSKGKHGARQHVTRTFGSRCQALRRHSHIIQLQLCESQHNAASNGDELVWSEWKPHADLDQSSRLPPLTGWTATLVGHTVYLIGGRRDDSNPFSDSIYAINLRLEHSQLLKQIEIIGRELEGTIPQYPQNLRDEAISAAKRALPSLQVTTSNTCRSDLRVMTLNVHEFFDPSRSRLLNHEVNKCVSLFAPDVICLQEVKHPLPAGREPLRPSSSSDHTALDALAAQVGDTFPFFKAYPNATIGNAILARHASEQTEVFHDNTGCQNTVLRVVKGFESCDLAVVSTHLTSQTDCDRLQLVESLRKCLRGYFKRPLTADCHELQLTCLPHILCVSFNASPERTSEAPSPSDRLDIPSHIVYEYLTQTKGYVDLNTESLQSTSQHSKAYILCSRALWCRVKSHHLHAQATGSDHLALLAHLTLAPRNNIVGLCGPVNVLEKILASDRAAKVQKVLYKAQNDFLKACEAMARDGVEMVVLYGEHVGHVAPALDRLFVLQDGDPTDEFRYMANSELCGSAAEAAERLADYFCLFNL
ncbi:uncharacterized protein MONBRDRAFT_24487 [Monosiga brevicollis MX1]|uniref:Endonuclease/exonuclease/phosphatase domain-containing protein n=1 Tax=Monosiga brevicollis TaxID=81824 RepID=A9UWK0_MONBE|nr:uncharacterized protein MONBRDRAFT_24487 [Monosiga brevicollis MX1]EDQ90226.1 predicted protein [Monosiga brevicollis MX1]|eukprot:XP_001744993.1 hypothetical protein [Monosiga brevicollis MX1]